LRLGAQVSAGMRAFPEEVVQGFDPIARDDDLVHDAVLLEGPDHEKLIVLVVFDQQDGLVGKVHARCSLSCVGQREEEGCALPDVALGPDAATMAGDDALHGRETDAGAGELGGAV